MEEISVLIVVDMQNDFVTGALRNEHAIKIVPNVAKKVEDATKSIHITPGQAQGIE